MRSYHNSKKNNIRLLKQKKFNKKFHFNNKNEQKKLKVTYQNPKFYDNHINNMTANIEEYAHHHPKYLMKKFNINNRIELPLNSMSSEKNKEKNLAYSEKTFSYNKTSKNLTSVKKNLFRNSETFYNESNIGEKYINNETENKKSDSVNKNKKSNSKKKYRIYTENITNFENSLNIQINNTYTNCNNSINNTINNTINNAINNTNNNTFSSNSNNNIINNININIKQSSYNINTITNYYQSLKHNLRRNKNIKIQHFSQSNIKSNNNTEIKNKLHKKSKINRLKESIQLSQPKLLTKVNNFKPLKSSYNEVIKKKREMLKNANSIYLSSPFRKNISEYEEKKNEANNENKNSRKKIWSSEYRNNNKKTYYEVSSNTKTIKSQSFSASKRNPKFRYKYIKNKVQMLSRNNFSKLEIFHTKSNNNISPKQIRRKSNIASSNYDIVSGANHSIKVITDISQNNLPTITNLTKINSISNKTKHKEIKKQIMDDKFSRYIIFGKNLLCRMEKKECNICHKYFDSHLFKIHYNSHPSQIFEWFYLGSFSNACDIKELRKNKINYILNCAIECHNKNLPKYIKELHLKIKDIENFDLINYFEEANEFINKCKLEGGTILVHCKLGISRSASFVIAYLIKNNNLSVEKALNFVKQKRNQIKPNEGFMSQLKKYERLIYLRKV